MPSISVTIEWDRPDEPFWLNADNVAVALHTYCKNTKFRVRPLAVHKTAKVTGPHFFTKPTPAPPKRV